MEVRRTQAWLCGRIIPHFANFSFFLTPIIPAKAGIQTAANAAGTPANTLCQHARLVVRAR